jgi:hypothetical protein
MKGWVGKEVQGSQKKQRRRNPRTKSKGIEQEKEKNKRGIAV